MTEYISRDDVRRFIADAFSENRFATNYDYAILSDEIDELPAADVQPVDDYVQNEILNYLFSKEREAENMPYSDIRQERIATLREVIRHVEGIGDTNG